MKICPRCETENKVNVRYCFNCGLLLTSAPVCKDGTGLLDSTIILSGRYNIMERVGKGGMGAVYKATDMRLRRRVVAIKEMSDYYIDDTLDKSKALEAFKQEAEILAILDHPNLPRVTDYFSCEGKEYLVMDFIEGRTLKDILRRTVGFLDENTVKEWTFQLFDVLHYLHNQVPPIIFRDLKPSNIMLEEKTNKIKLIDFGIARLFKPGQSSDTTIMATGGYSPPEQLGARQTDERSDVFSLGSTLHHLLTGHHPKKSLFSFSPVRTININVSEVFEYVIMKAVDLKPSGRWQSISEMKEALVSPNISSDKCLEREVPEDSFNQETENCDLLVVSPEKKDCFRTINDALSAASEGSKILINPGIYHEKIVLSKNVEIIGKGNVSEIILENNAGCVIMDTDVALIGNMTIKALPEDSPMPAIDILRGQLLLDECHVFSCNGPGISIHGHNSNPVINNCIIKSNNETAVNIFDGGVPVMEFCEITGEKGISVFNKGMPYINNCKIQNNKDWGIKFYNGGTGVIEDCEVYGNGKSGIIIQDKSNPFVKGCKIHNESRGIIVSDYGEGAFEYCEIYSNSNYSMEIFNHGNPSFSHCKVYDNSQGIYIYNKGNGFFEGCEIFRNNGIGIEITSKANPFFKNCNIYDCKGHGIYVWLNGGGTVEKSRIYNNISSPVEIAHNCTAIVKDCTFA